MNSILTPKQEKTFYKDINPFDNIKVTIRYDDSCRNGHNSFGISCNDQEKIKQYFPELVKYLKWHGMNSDGPLYYYENTIFLAGMKDSYGHDKNEQITDRDGVPMWQLVLENPSLIWSHTKPEVKAEYLPYVSGGKERELDAARRAAIWPEATDDDLCLPGLKERLEARLPGLIEEFRKDLTELGFVY